MKSNQKERRLDAISNAGGVIAAVAMDQRRSLRGMIARAANLPAESINDGQLVNFKTAISAVLTPHASAILLDPEYGLPAANVKAKNCGLLLTYEADGYENPRPHRMLALLPNLSVKRLRDLGADAIKILLSYAPGDDECANDEKRAWIERIGAECDALDIPFLLEPVVYDPAGADPRSLEFARRKPDLVVRTMQEFSKPLYRVDVLKVEFPVISAYVEGTRVYSGRKAYDKNEALSWFRAADSAAGRPYIYLSAGAEISEFLASLELAAEAGARFSGVLCGRAMWQDGIPHFVRGGTAAFRNWLEAEGVHNARQIQQCLQGATPWRQAASGVHA